jgi:hypothetical protein
MAKICSRLKSAGMNMKNLSALEFYAREGDWQTIVYAREVRSIEAWEINPEFLSGLQQNLPAATTRLVDSYVYGMQTNNRFDFVVLDNPQATFGTEGRCYCEHFEALPVALRLLTPRAILIFNLNWAPFNFESNKEWQSRRAEFYGVKDTSCLPLDQFLLPFYQCYFEARGFKVIEKFAQPRNDEYLAYAVFHLSSK